LLRWITVLTYGFEPAVVCLEDDLNDGH